MSNPLARMTITIMKLLMRLFGIYDKFRTFSDELLLTFIASHRNNDAITMLNPDLQLYEDYGSLLHFALDHGNITIARYLIELGADVDSLGPNNETPLTVAIENMRTNCVRVLLKANARVDAVNAAGNSALQILYKSHFTNPKIMEAIHDKMKSDTPNVDVLIGRVIRAGGSLCHIVYFKDTQILARALPHFDFDLNVQGPSRMTALHSAVYLQNLELAKWLVYHGADVNLVDEYNAGPLSHAVIRGDEKMMRLLLEHGADPNTVNDTDQSTPLYVAVRYRKDTKIVELLIEFGAVIRNASGHLRTIFDQALLNQKNEVVNVLVGHLAMLERLGTTDVKSVMYCDDDENREAMSQAEKYYDLCQKTLDLSVFGSLKLFDLLVANDSKMKLLARNNTFIYKIDNFCSEHKLKKLCSYYYNTLIRRVAKAVRLVKLENDAIPVICDLFDVNYNQCYFVIRKIVGYLSDPDLVELCRMKHLF